METTQLSLTDYRRYGRQMILDGFGLPGQLKLLKSSVVVVGAGGLGCPALQYLAATGIGRIGIIDGDQVELSNLQRQVLHKERTIGMNKARSAAESIKEINSTTKLDVYEEALTPANAKSLLSGYDIILDCTDNAPTRYLLSDTAVSLGKPLVSGAAQKLEGQLCTYNLGETGPCYRCLFPSHPAPEFSKSCEETGILGVVTGIIGNLQALEAIKIITGLNDTTPSLLIFSAIGRQPFRTIKLRSKKASCVACGKDEAQVSKIDKTDYVQFCGGKVPDWVQRGLDFSNPDLRILPKDLHQQIISHIPHIIIDVRSAAEFGICHLPGSINIPLNELVTSPTSFQSSEATRDVYVVCRLGNDSRIAADTLRESGTQTVVKDLVGGLVAWAKEVDGLFPVY